MLRIVIADADEVLSLRIFAAISPAQGLEVVGTAHDGASALETVRRTQPDVVLVDLLMPPQGGLALLAALRDAVPETQVLVLAAETGEKTLQAAFAAGALGVLAKDGSTYFPRDVGRSGVNGRVPQACLAVRTQRVQSTKRLTTVWPNGRPADRAPCPTLRSGRR